MRLIVASCYVPVDSSWCPRTHHWNLRIRKVADVSGKRLLDYGGSPPPASLKKEIPQPLVAKSVRIEE
jgi:hypothetical protein